MGRDPEDYLYDLYAVCNHHGTMQGGHYTGNQATITTNNLWFCHALSTWRVGLIYISFLSKKHDEKLDFNRLLRVFRARVNIGVSSLN